ncbi:extracellular solute-binding protein [Glycomyces sp. TRM65418]|uniref:extracellular solute-binding protein n=1 Tax=Glycomyces sp. TRM65418 TaxID=2867006 RepID=UPI001CE6AE7D|nr:extracellular solute-binding protein [Glycomyces sp. TRM65418]MCC3765966.1 extracellular solute-binding protein [Glycomyces sp. TRM65418]QZD55546.1 extracellular solute-binding protein [Glycomyces sp. TRM65418]
MRRRGVVAVAAAAALGLAACGGPAEEEQASELEWDGESQQYVIEEDVASGAVPLKVWFEEDYLAEAVIAAFKEEFKDEYPDMRIEYELVGKHDAVDKMALAGEAGTGADVFMTFYNEIPNAIDDGTAAPLGEYSDVLQERMSEAFTSVVSVDDQMHAVPVTTESLGLIYNTTLLQELTGSSEPAATWEEIKALAAEYNDPGTNRWTIRMSTMEIYRAYPILSAMGWQVYPDGNVDEPGFDDPALTPALDYYAGLRDIYNVPSADSTWETIEEGFAKGETPYVITGPWSFALFDEGAAANGFEYGVTTLPTVEGGETAGSFAGMHVAAVSGYSEHPAAARVFANFLASDAGAATVYAATGQIPALNADLLAGIEGIEDDPHVAGIVAQSANAELIPQVPEYFWEVGDAMVTDVWDDLSDSAAAQEKAVTTYNELHGI